MPRLITLALTTAALLLLASTALAADVNDPGGTFYDDDGSVFESSIEAIFAEGITSGCSDRQEFCPTKPITRGEFAAFLNRALDLPAPSKDYFTDDDESIFENDINRLAESGITKGCNPPDNTNFCPDGKVTREAMAAFLARAFELTDQGEGDIFVDDDESMFEKDIDKLATAGITKGCNPPDNTMFCPTDFVSRGAMAAFLTRALGLTPLTPPPRPPTHLVAKFTTYHKCCEPRVTNIQVMARQMDGAVILPWEEFDLNAYLGPRTTAKGYVPAPILLNGEGYCCDHPLNIGGGTSQFGTTFYNPVFWGAYDEVSHKPHSRYIARYPLGIEATLGWPTPNVVFVNDTWTPIIVDTKYTSTSITVEFWGNNGGRTVVGSHSGGTTYITVTAAGDATARKVTGTVTGSATYDSGGVVKIVRTIDGPSGVESETWWHTYLGG